MVQVCHLRLILIMYLVTILALEMIQLNGYLDTKAIIEAGGKVFHFIREKRDILYFFHFISIFFRPGCLWPPARSFRELVK